MWKWRIRFRWSWKVGFEVGRKWSPKNWSQRISRSRKSWWSVGCVGLANLPVGRNWTATSRRTIWTQISRMIQNRPDNPSANSTITSSARNVRNYSPVSNPSDATALSTTPPTKPAEKESWTKRKTERKCWPRKSSVSFARRWFRRDIWRRITRGITMWMPGSWSVISAGNGSLISRTWPRIWRWITRRGRPFLVPTVSLPRICRSILRIILGRGIWIRGSFVRFVDRLWWIGIS